jgi:mRNA interferase RelE/StbE
MTSSARWASEFSQSAAREFARLDFAAQKRITRYIETRILGGDPRRFGKPLRADLHGLLRWRVLQDCRIIGQIQEGRLLILIVRVAHRSTVYGD